MVSPTREKSRFQVTLVGASHAGWWRLAAPLPAMGPRASAGGVVGCAGVAVATRGRPENATFAAGRQGAEMSWWRKSTLRIVPLPKSGRGVLLGVRDDVRVRCRRETRFSNYSLAVTIHAGAMARVAGAAARQVAVAVAFRKMA